MSGSFCDGFKAGFVPLFCWIASLTKSDAHHPRHREEQSDEAIHLSTRSKPTMNCRVGLRPPRNDEDVFEMLALVKAGRTNLARHCEEQSDVAIHLSTRTFPLILRSDAKHRVSKDEGNQ